MNDHPHQLLAEYVDGSLGADDRARVAAHLEACAACREEAALADRARQVLAALPEAEPPAGLGMAAVREARRRPGRSAAGRLARVLPAAAVLLIGGVIAVALMQGGNGDEAASPADDAAMEPYEEEGAPAAEEAPQERAAPAPAFRTSDTDHDAQSLQRLARSLRANARTALDEGFPLAAVEYYDAFDAEALSPRAADALACVTNAFSPDRSVVPFLVERSSFQGQAAFVAVFLQGPSPEAEYDRLVIIAADRATCSLRLLATQRL